MFELTPQQIAVLEMLAGQGFAIASFPMYGNAIGVRRGECAALLVPGNTAPLALQGEPCYLLNGNLAVAVERGGKKMYVWKKQAIEATPERQGALLAFRADLTRVLQAVP